MKRMFQMLNLTALAAGAAAGLKALGNTEPPKRPTAQRAGKNRPTAHYLHATGQREALRAFRRAQGGPGIELINGVWQPRA